MKYYIPTTSLNIDSILSTESISPLCFYSNRKFGPKKFEKIPYNISDFSLYLFSEVPGFELYDQNDDFEQYPIVIEFDDDKQLNGCSVDTIFKCSDYEIVSCKDTLYLTPWNSSVLFFDKRAYSSSRIIIESSRNCKLGANFMWKQVVPKFPLTDMLSHVVEKSLAAVKNFDYEINAAKGGLWGYILGKSKSISPDVAKLLLLYNKMRNIISNAISNSGVCAANFYDQLISFDKQYRDIADREANLHWNDECTETDKYVLEKFKVLNDAKIKFCQLHNYYLTPDVPKISSDKDYWISYREKLALYTTAYIKKNTECSKIKLDSISFQDEALSISGFYVVSNLLHFILKGKINKENLRINRIDVARFVLEELASMYKSKKGEDYWKKSVERNFVNTLFYNIQDFEPFDINSIEDIELKSIAAFLLKGEDYDALIRYLQDNSFSDYSLVLTLWGACEGYASLYKGLIAPIITPSLISEVYKIIGLDVNEESFPLKESIVYKTSDPIKPNYNDTLKTSDVSSTPSILKEDIYSKLCAVKNGKKSLSKDVIRKVAKLYEECGNRSSRIFYDELLKISGVGKGAYDGIKKVLGSDDSVSEKGDAINRLSKHDQDQVTSVFMDSVQSTGNFLNDFEFLVNNHEFVSILSQVQKNWIEDLRWFIDAHKPGSQDYYKYYKDKDRDNKTVIIQFITFKKGLYSVVKDFLFRIYKING